ncbi:MAG: amino acid permease [Acidimicrobiales bacterium]|nr:amino acid permease [Acidimicrobiales bacterium]
MPERLTSSARAGVESGPPGENGGLERSLTLPWLVFYGVGVTVGAGIFALVGEIVSLSGDNAPLAFLVAGLVAGVTAVCYMQLVRAFPRAGGEAVYANRGLGMVAGRIAGLGVVVTGTISSAVIAIAFAGYVRSLVDVPESIVIVAVIVGLAAIAMAGVRESVVFAAVITVIEVGTLLVVIYFGLPLLDDGGGIVDAVTPGVDGAGLSPIFAGAVVAFFAFVGFEDIANMAEETVEPRRTAPRAILWTLSITMVVYTLLSVIAVLVVDRAAITESDAPVAALFEAVSGHDGRIVSVIAVVAMINGILVQIVMASRMLYGMAKERLLPPFFAVVQPSRQTPVRATLAVTGAIVVLALFFPLVELARATSVVILSVFTLVDFSLFALATKSPEMELGRWRWVGLVGGLLAIALAGWEVSNWVT